MGAGTKVAILGTALAAALGVVMAVAWESAPGEPDAPDTAAVAIGTVAKAPPARREPKRAERSRHDEPKPLAPPTGDFRLTGVVVDEEEKPAGGATVRVLRSGVPADETRSDAAGRFSLRCGKRPATGTVELGISATSGPARATFESYDLMEDAAESDDVGVLQLEAAVPLTARIVDGAGPVPGARVYVGSFFGTIFATADADAKGVARFETTPASDAWLFAYAPGHGRGRGEIPDGRDPKVPLVLTVTSRKLRVSVVEVPAGVPLAGERIAVRLVTDADGQRLFSSIVPPLDLPATGDTGIVEIADIAADDALQLRRADPVGLEQRPWKSAGPGSRPVVAGPREIEARIDVPSGRTLSWRIVPGDVPAPQEGAVVSLRRGAFGTLPAGPTALHVEDGNLVGTGFSEGEMTGIAVAEDGSIAALGRGAEARFLKPRSLVVKVTDESGTPIEDVLVSLKEARNRGVGEPVATDTEGLATFRELEPELGVLDISTKTESPADVRWVAAVDLAKGDAHVGVKLPRANTIVLRVTTDGERKLPGVWRVLLNQFMDTSAAAEVPADIRIVARPVTPETPIHVSLRAEGYLDAEADVTCAAGDATTYVDLALEQGITLVAEVRMPSASLSAGAVVALQRWSTESRVWEDSRDRPYLGTQRRADADGRFRFLAMPPGRYRLFAGMFFTASAPVEAVHGATPPVLTLDVSRGGAVKVRIVGPDDKTVAQAWVGCDTGDGVEWRRGTGNGAEAGIATVYVPGDRVVHLTARHWLMRPDPEKGSVDVTEAGGEVVLRLAEGPVLGFNLTLALPAWSIPSNVARISQNDATWSQIQLFQAAAEGTPVAAFNAIKVDGRFRAGGFAPGRYTIWMRFPGGAPIVLPYVDLHDGLNDLGDLRAPRGSAVRLKLAVPEGQAAPRVLVIATRLDPPRYVAGVTSKGEAEVELAGLGPGRFDLVVRPVGRETDTLLRRTVEVDGVHDIVIDSSPR